MKCEQAASIISDQTFNYINNKKMHFCVSSLFFWVTFLGISLLIIFFCTYAYLMQYLTVWINLQMQPPQCKKLFGSHSLLTYYLYVFIEWET